MSNAPPKRRWYQFSLRTLLVLLLAGCMLLGWAQRNRERVAANEKAVAEIERLGGEVESMRKGSQSATWFEKLFDDPGDRVSRASLLLVNLSGNDKIDACLEHTKELTDDFVLALSYTHATDTSLGHLKGMTNLKGLYLDITRVTDAGLEHLRGLTNLEELSLEGTNVTDAGVKKLQRALPNCVIFRTDAELEPAQAAGTESPPFP